MAKKKPDLSDWIQYLISERSQHYKLTTTCLSLALGLFSVAMFIMATVGTKAFILNFMYIVFFSEIFFLCYVGIRELSRSNRVSKLLEAIFEEKTDIKKIKKEWFEGRGVRKKMFEDISIFAWKRLRDFTITLGIGIMGIGIILMTWGAEFFSMIGIQWIGSMGVAILAIGVAFHSIVIAKESDNKMKIVESMNIRRMIDEFLDRRLMLHERLLSIKRTVNYAENNEMKKENELLLYKGKSDFEIYYIFSVWVCLRYLREINKLRERLNSDNQKVIIKDTSILFDDLDWGLDFIVKNFDEKYDMDPEYKSQIKQIYDIVSDFNEFEHSKFGDNIVKRKDKLTK